MPYYDRGEILDGALDGQHLEICWIKDQTDALLIPIQGSARVRLEDGTMLRINYDAHNGYPYVPVGRILIERNIIPREEISLARIREWMRANPQSAEDVRRQNRSFVFFRIAIFRVRMCDNCVPSRPTPPYDKDWVVPPKMNCRSRLCACAASTPRDRAATDTMVPMMRQPMLRCLHVRARHDD
jgi:hypothetical protein